MKPNIEIHLVRVNTQLISINNEIIEPTSWDRKVIYGDLKDFIQSTRLVKATPTLRIEGEKLVLLNGLPFVQACLDSAPPVREIICAIKAEKKQLSNLDIEFINPAEMLDSTGDFYWATEMLTFKRELNDDQKQMIERKIFQFYLDVSQKISEFGNNYRAFEVFEWNSNAKVKWRWERTDNEGNHLLYFHNLLEEIDHNIAPIRSWNGIAIFS